jgi:hypothetical protein
MKAAEYRRAALAGMNEDELRDKLIRPLAETLGWRVYFTWRSKHSPAGFPDLVLVHGAAGRLLFPELKKDMPPNPSPSALKRLSPTAAQQAWLDDLAAVAAFCGGRVWVGVWRPVDWANGVIQRELRDLQTRAA